MSIYTQDLCNEVHATSRLKIRKVNLNNSGTYRCAVSYAESATTTIHVLPARGELKARCNPILKKSLVIAAASMNTQSDTSTILNTNQLYSNFDEPYFDVDIQTNVTAVSGSSALFKCKFHNLKDYLVTSNYPYFSINNFKLIFCRLFGPSA